MLTNKFKATEARCWNTESGSWGRSLTVFIYAQGVLSLVSCKMNAECYFHFLHESENPLQEKKSSGFFSLARTGTNISFHKQNFGKVGFILKAKRLRLRLQGRTISHTVSCWAFPCVLVSWCLSWYVDITNAFMSTQQVESFCQDAFRII